MTTFKVPLQLAGAPSPPRSTAGVLSYSVEPYDPTSPGRSQRRFTDRLVLKPQIDLDAYRCRAKVDRVLVRVSLGRTTQGRHINGHLKRTLKQTCYARAPAKDVRDVFDILFQDPAPSALRKAIEAIRTKYGLIGDVRISRIEISVDWFPKNASDEDRYKMVGSMFRHHLPTGRKFPSPREDMRQFYGETEFVISAPKRVRHVSDTAIEDETVRHRIRRERFSPFQHYVDATVYRGDKDGPVLFRIYNKTEDERKYGSTRSLSPEDRCARIEVELNGPALAAYGLTDLDSLWNFNFRSISADLFPFWLPTIQKYHKGLAPLQNRLLWLQTHHFRSGGVYAHELYAKATERHMKLSYRSESLPVRKKRVAGGDTGYLVAWKEINKRTGDALTKLSQQWKA